MSAQEVPSDADEAVEAAETAVPIAPAPQFRRVTPPPAGFSGRRITIQVTAEEYAAYMNPPARPDGPPVTEAAATVTPHGPRRPSGRSDWFWAEVSPSLPADPARFWAAQALVQRAPDADALRAPRLSTLHSIIEAHGRDILLASLDSDVSPALALAVMAVESAGRSDAVSSAGAQGLMQLIPATASRFGVEDPFDSVQNIAGGVAYLDWLLEEFDGDPILALAGYNAGEGAVRRAGGVPEYPETRDYVPKVLAAWVMARTLCLTPPELVSDGCVFQSITASN